MIQFCLLLARMRRAGTSALAPLVGDKWTRLGHCKTDAVDPQQTWRLTFTSPEQRCGSIAISLNRAFVPFDASARQVRNLKAAILDGEWLLQNGIGPVLPFQPVSRFSDAHQMRRHFWIQMR